MRLNAGSLIAARAYSSRRVGDRAGRGHRERGVLADLRSARERPRTKHPRSVPDPPGLLAYGEACKSANHDVLAGLGRELVAQLLDCLAVELGVMHLLLEQHDRLIPGVELALDDALAHVLGL